MIRRVERPVYLQTSHFPAGEPIGCFGHGRPIDDLSQKQLVKVLRENRMAASGRMPVCVLGAQCSHYIVAGIFFFKFKIAPY